MTKWLKVMVVMVIASSMLLSGCQKETGSGTPDPTGQAGETQKPGETGSNEGDPTLAPTPTPTPKEPIDVAKVKPNEAGKIMVVMFHNFVETFTPTKWDNGEYTTTFDEFRKLLQDLYDKDYRLVSMQDYLNNNISVPAGTIPMIFTFDDGTAGQFNLVEENGQLVVNKQSAVGIMEEFNQTHPDFGLKGVFYVNLGNSTFDGKGNLDERLKYLVNQGFEIGNHTFTHINLSQAKSADAIQKEIGGNQQKMYEYVPDYKMMTFSLPYGSPANDLKDYVEKGEYQGTSYEHFAIMEVGWDPTHSPISKKFNPLSTHRVRASGINPVDADLAWWLENLSRGEQYVSDGDANTVTIPKSKEGDIDKERLNGKELILY